jgi:hypothetical protein
MFKYLKAPLKMENIKNLLIKYYQRKYITGDKKTALSLYYSLENFTIMGNLNDS